MGGACVKYLVEERARLGDRYICGTVVPRYVQHIYRLPL